jgi:hypothetical protein
MLSRQRHTTALVEPVEEARERERPALSPELVDELGRILGEALVQQYQRDAAAMVKPPRGPNHSDQVEPEVRR